MRDQTLIHERKAGTQTTATVQTGLLQRTCACGGAPGVDGQCTECREKRLSTQGQVTPMTLQTKLTVNKPGDRYEQEADRVAEQVMRMPESVRASTSSDQMEGMHIQRLQIDHQELHRQPETEEEDEEEIILAKENAGQVPAVTPDLQSRIDYLKGRGQPLPDSTRTLMESHFGHDFSRVRIHADTRAAETARILNAKAYTVGHNIVFGVGQYTPTTYSGQKLLAHELTHVVQQLSDPTLAQPTLLQRQPATKSSSSVTNPDSEQAKLYNLTIGPDVLTNATSTQVIQALKRLYRRLIIKTDSGQGAHEDLIKIRNDQWIVGFFSDTLGGVSMPPLSIWLEPRNRLGAALATLNAGLVDQSVQNLISAEEAYQQAYQRFYTYREGTISGADTSIT